MQVRGLVGIVAVSTLLLVSCGSDGGDGEESAPTSSTTSTTSTTTSTSSTTSSAGEEQGGLAGGDSFTASVVGKTYAAANGAGVHAHQQSDFGSSGSWSLFTVERDGQWYAFTSVNKVPADGPGYLAEDSKVVSGELLRDLSEGDWYGVAGVVRDGRPLGGVMMHGRGQEREADGTYPVLDAWRVNLETLRLEPSSVSGLDIVESCG